MARRAEIRFVHYAHNYDSAQSSTLFVGPVAYSADNPAGLGPAQLWCQRPRWCFRGSILFGNFGPVRHHESWKISCIRYRHHGSIGPVRYPEIWDLAAFDTGITEMLGQNWHRSFL